jgi:manganese oxidase
MKRSIIALAAATALAGTAAFSLTATSFAGGGAKVITYYVAAEEIEWDYAPTGKNVITGEDFTAEENVFVEAGPDRIGRVYTKTVYREYTDATFSVKKARTAKDEHLGLLGPTLRAEVGQTIRVVFKNKLDIGATMHPHGVFYNKDSEGAPYADGSSGADKADDDVPPGATHTYNWHVPERAGPGPADPDSVMWMYHSHLDEIADTNAGLMGSIIVTRKGRTRPDGTPKDVNREFVLVFSVFDENASTMLDKNLAKLTAPTKPLDELVEDGDFVESNLMHGINGYVYGNLPGLDMKTGDKVRWYTMGMGTEVDLHTPHTHGNVFTVMGMRADVAELLPASMKTLEMTVDNPGTWLFHCHVNDHITAGMSAVYNVAAGHGMTGAPGPGGGHASMAHKKQG